MDVAQLSGPGVAETYAFAKLVAGCTFLPERIRTDARAVFLMLMTGREMGLTSTHALRSLYVTPDGKVGIQGDAALALLVSKGFRVEFPVSTEQECRCKITRPGPEGQVFEDVFTMADADRAGINKGRDGNPKYNWKAYPKVMLRWRALMQTARVIAADVLGGVYSEDEIEEILAHADPPPESPGQRQKRRAEAIERAAPEPEPPPGTVRLYIGPPATAAPPAPAPAPTAIISESPIPQPLPPEVTTKAGPRAISESLIPPEFESCYRDSAHDAGKPQGWATDQLLDLQTELADAKREGMIPEALHEFCKRRVQDAILLFQKEAEDNPRPKRGRKPKAKASETAQAAPKPTPTASAAVETTKTEEPPWDLY